MDNDDILKKLYDKYGAFYKPNTIIFNEGDLADKFYILRKGLVKIVKETPENPITINTIEPGEVFGEMGLITDKPRNASAVTLSESFIICLNEDTLNSLMKNNKEFIRFLLKAFGNKIRYLSNMVKDLTHGDDFIIITTYFANYLNTIQERYNIKLNINTVLKHISIECQTPFDTVMSVLKTLEKQNVFRIKNDLIHILDKTLALSKIPRYF